MSVKVYETSIKGNKYSLLSDIRYVIYLFKIIKKEKPSSVFSYTLKPIFYTSFVSKLLGVNSINSMLTGLGYNFISNNLSARVIRRLLKYSLKCNNQVIFQNEDDLKLLNDIGLLGSKTLTNVVNGSGVDLDQFANVDVDISGEVTFTMVGRLLKSKGIEEFFRAAKLLKGRYEGVNFQLLGDYDPESIDSIDTNIYKNIIKGDIIDYKGRVNNVEYFIKKSSIVVLPSYREGTPRSILEAMSVGRAVITTDTAGCRQTVCLTKGMQNGFLVPVKNVNLLADSMEEFIKNKSLIVAFGKNSRKYVEKKYDVNKVNKEMLRILNIKN
jgi:glycosyltransferase involved in cell wall biosynthesis